MVWEENFCHEAQRGDVSVHQFEAESNVEEKGHARWEEQPRHRGVGF